jgi:glutathione S-transferase
MLIIYAIPLSLYCAKLRILLRHKNLEWQEIQPPGGYGSKEYKTIIPSGNLPALIDADLKLADSEAIAEYLEEKFKEPPMLPEDIDVRAKARELSRFHDTRLEPEVRALFSHIVPDTRNPEVIKAQSDKISERLNQLAVILEEWSVMAPEFLTLGDCGYQVTFLWIDALTPLLKLSINWPETVIEYRDKLTKIPAVATEIQSYKPVLSAWLYPGEKL